MCGCARRARICRSRVKRRRRLLSARPGRSSFSATRRWYRPSARAASQTWPMPPSPSRRSSRYGPTSAPARRPASGAISGSERKSSLVFVERDQRLAVRRRAPDPPRAARCRRCARASSARARTARRAAVTAVASARCPWALPLGRPQESFSDASRNNRAFCQSRRMLRSERFEQRGDLQFRQAGEVAQFDHLGQALDRPRPAWSARCRGRACPRPGAGRLRRPRAVR